MPSERYSVFGSPLSFAKGSTAIESMRVAAPPGAASPSAPAQAPKKSVPFLEDDYGKALHEARARKVPIFIEAWAPW